MALVGLDGSVGVGSPAAAAELVVDGTAGDDRFLVQVDPATAGRIEVWLGDALVGSAVREGLAGVRLNGLLGDDLVTVDYANGFFDVLTTVHGGGQSTPSGDGLLVRGSVPAGGSASYWTGAAGSNGKSGTLVHESDGRVHEIRFTGLEPICTLTTGTLTINTTVSGDTVNVSAGPLCGPETTYKVDFAGAAEEIYFRNRTALVVNAGNGADFLTLDLPTRRDTSLTSITLSGDAGTDSVIIKNAPPNVTVTANGGDDADSLSLLASSAALTRLYGGAGNDVFFLGNGANVLTGLVGPIEVEGDAHDAVPTTTLTIGGSSNTLPSGDQLTFFDQGESAGYAATLTPTSFARDGMGGSVSFDTIETITFHSSTGSSIVNLTGTASSVSTVIETAGGHDTVSVTSTGTSSNVTVNTAGGADSVTVAAMAAGFLQADGGAGSNAFDYQGAPAALFPTSPVDGFLVAPAGGRVGYASFDGLSGKFLLDFGDAPDPGFPTLLATNGARHAGDGSLRLGPTWDGELEGQPGAAASGDGVDEDGISFTSAIEIGLDSTGATLSVVSSAFGKLDAWIDFNADGDFADPNEQIFTNKAVMGTVDTSFTAFAESQPGPTFGRFRLSTSGSLQTTGLASDGEVEDYAVIVKPPLDLDLFNRVESGPRTFWACNSISAGDPSGYGIVSGTVTFRAGTVVVLRSGFSVAAGAGFVVELGPVAGCD